MKKRLNKCEIYHILLRHLYESRVIQKYRENSQSDPCITTIVAMRIANSETDFLCSTNARNHSCIIPAS